MFMPKIIRIVIQSPIPENCRMKWGKVGSHIKLTSLKSQDKMGQMRGVSMARTSLWQPGVTAALVLAGGLAIALLPWEGALAILLGVAAVAATLLRPAWALCLLILAVPYGSLREISLGVMQIGAAEALAVWILALWLLRLALNRRIILPQPPLLWPLAAFLFAALLSIPGAISLQYSLKGLLLWLEFALLYLFVVANVDKKEATGLALASFVVAATQAVLGAYQFVTGSGPESFLILGQFSRAYGTFEQPNPYGGYLGFILPVALGVALGRGPGVGPRAVSLAAAGLLLMGVGLSWSRGAWLAVSTALFFVAIFGVWSRAFDHKILAIAFGLAMGAGAFLWLGPNPVGLLLGATAAIGGGVLFGWGLGRRMVPVLFLLLLLGGLMVWSLGFSQILPQEVASRLLDFLPYWGQGDVRYMPLSDENYPVVERLALWQAALGMIQDRPWLGVGIGNYVPVYPAYAVPGWDDPLGHPHNYYLNIAAETGLLGLLAYLTFWATTLIYGLRALFRVSAEKRGLVLGILGMVVGLSVHNLVDNLYVHAMNLQIALFLGLLTVLAERGEAFSGCAISKKRGKSGH